MVSFKLRGPLFKAHIMHISQASGYQWTRTYLVAAKVTLASV